MVDRPDLDEFLGALNGFLEKKPTASQDPDPSYLRFLEIFCRSVGSSEGHLLQRIGDQNLQSIISFGVPSNFEKDFNAALLTPGRESSPLDSAMRDQQVLAVVELKVGSGVPSWFMDLAAKYKFKSLVAVPLIGNNRAVGVLCAYYRDVCLFDQGTLDRLTTIGRMVGTAMDKNNSIASEISESAGSGLDIFLQLLTTKASTKAHVYEALIKVLSKSLSASGIVCGPLRVGNELTMTIADGTGVPPTAISQRVAMSAILAERLVLGSGKKRIDKASAEEWGAMRPYLSTKNFSALVTPIIWQKQPHAGIIAWRTDQRPFTEGEELLMSRLSAIAALALRAI